VAVRANEAMVAEAAMGETNLTSITMVAIYLVMRRRIALSSIRINVLTSGSAQLIKNTYSLRRRRQIKPIQPIGAKSRKLRRSSIYLRLRRYRYHRLREVKSQRKPLRRRTIIGG